jgi:hypothetical protein
MSGAIPPVNVADCSFAVTKALRPIPLIPANFKGREDMADVTESLLICGFPYFLLRNLV